jgi:hypothetical protein
MNLRFNKFICKKVFESTLFACYFFAKVDNPQIKKSKNFNKAAKFCAYGIHSIYFKFEEL